MEWHRLKLVCPVIVGENRLQLLLATFHRMALLESKLDQFLHHLRMKRVEHVEKEFTIALPSLRIRVWKELSHPFELDDLFVKALD